MTKLYLFTIFCWVILFSSCSHIYEPALYHQDIAYMPKPTSFDSIRTSNYLSGALVAHSNSNFNDFLISSQFNISRGYVFDHFNIAYGAFGVLGDYQSDQSSNSASNYFSDKFFGAAGARFSANAFAKMGRADFRFIGVEVAYSHEFGSYADFRQYLNKIPGSFVDPRTDLYSIGLTTEVIFHNRHNINFEHGFRGFFGTTLGYNQLDYTYYKNQTSTDNLFRTFFPKLTYFLRYNKFFATIDGGVDFFVRFGYRF